MKYFNWQCRPGHTNSWLGTRLSSGVTRLTAEEWPKIRAAIDTGQPAPLGLVKVESWRIQDMAKNHQVLCFGYDAADDDSAATLHCYDPNWPGQDVTLSLDLSAPDETASGTVADYSGVLFYQDARAPSFQGNNLRTNAVQGGSGDRIEGALYFPSQEVFMTGGASSSDTCLQIVARKVTLQGNAVVRHGAAACKNLGVSPIVPTGVRLV